MKKSVDTQDRSTHSDLDSLTGLLNRSGFEKQLEYMSGNISSEEIGHAFLYIDLDLFKTVNDVHGHAAGDALICAISNIIKSKIRNEDLFARLGGDEFGLIITQCTSVNAERIAELIRKAIRDYKGELDSDVYGVSASIGISMLKPEENNISDLMRKADIACYAAKNSGRDRVQIYKDSDQKISLHNDDMQWFNQINKALESDLFCLFVQPIYPLAASEIINRLPACEVLLRMKNELGHIISPGVFLPPAIRYGMASRIDKWVISAVLDYLDANVRSTRKFSLITINLSGQSLGDDVLLEFLMARLEKLKIPPSLLCFEITETEAIENMSAAIQFINTIKRIYGCKFALDDFGSGFSSFRYIKELPVDIVKIDGGFVKDMMNDSVSRILIKALNDIAQVSNKKTVAEWVETREILDEVQSLGFNYGQGYYLSSPMPIEEFMCNEIIKAS